MIAAQVVGLVPRARVLRQVVEAVLLALRPEPFSPHIGADARENLHAAVAERDERHDEEDEEGDDEVHLDRDGETQEAMHQRTSGHY